MHHWIITICSLYNLFYSRISKYFENINFVSQYPWVVLQIRRRIKWIELNCLMIHKSVEMERTEHKSCVSYFPYLLSVATNLFQNMGDFMTPSCWCDNFRQLLLSNTNVQRTDVFLILWNIFSKCIQGRLDCIGETMIDKGETLLKLGIKMSFKSYLFSKYLSLFNM